MASSIASKAFLGVEEGKVLVHVPKQTAIDKIGGIFCHICNSIYGNKKDYDSHYAQHKTQGSDIVYTCIVCKRQISGYPSFRGHCYLNHVVKNRFPCNHCNKSFSKLCILNTHISSVHEYKCSSCDEKFSSKNELQLHKNVHSVKRIKNEPPYDCTNCGKLLKTLDICESHIDDHSTILYPCPICNEVLPNKFEATKHLTKHFDEAIPEDISLETPSEDSSIDILGGILCCHCDVLFRNRTEIDSHFKAEHEDKEIVYTCNICSKQYEKYLMFGSHCHYHISRERFQCVECDRTFPRLSLLVIHTEAFHSDCTLDKPFSCEQCGHSFMTRYRLREHMRLVHEESTIRCSKSGCFATFENSRDLILHQKRHKTLENWCRQCGLHFATLMAASQHLDVHRRAQYTCPICNRAYREKYLMVKHLPSHFASILHMCRLCGKTFSLASRLAQHLKTHSDTRAYRCTFCPKGFMKPHELEQHLNVHTGRRPYRCSECPKTFANHPNWRKHLMRVHGLDNALVKKLKVAHDAEVAAENSTSPQKPESNSSEISLDFADSEESDDRNKFEMIEPEDMNIISDPITGERLTVSDTVNAVINRIDSLGDNLDLLLENEEDFTTETPEFNTGIRSEVEDDTSDIKAIVEHIESMSEEMEMANSMGSAMDASGLVTAENESLQFVEMMPVENTAYNPIPDNILPSESYYSSEAQYGLEYPTEDLPGLINVDDHMLPHIDPLLTIKAEETAKMYVQNLNTYEFAQYDTTPTYNCQQWEPIITKVYNTEANDVNPMFIC